MQPMSTQIIYWLKKKTGLNLLSSDWEVQNAIGVWVERGIVWQCRWSLEILFYIGDSGKLFHWVVELPFCAPAFTCSRIIIRHTNGHKQ